VPISDGEIQIISSSIDAAIREAVTAFTLAHAAFREQFVATLAHDLRNPLAAASTAAQLIPHIRDFEKIDIFANKISVHLSRIDKMIQDLLDTVMFQHGERLSLHPSNFDIMEVVKEVCEQASDVYGPRFAIAGTAINGWWGRDAIKRTLENLISNAIKYGARDTPIRISSKEYGGRLLLSVHNQGSPIPPDRMAIRMDGALGCPMCVASQKAMAAALMWTVQRRGAPQFPSTYPSIRGRSRTRPRSDDMAFWKR
jgi:signal transduction histidine kinase